MKNWLEQVTGKVTMYVLIALILGLMLVWALFLSLTGGIGYSSVQVLAGAGVLVTTSYLANWILGRAYGLRPQGISALITGLILFFIFSPTDTLAGLSGLALVALFAQASKYVLAFRGRHIFNPVAIAAVIIELLGIAYTSWWVATPALLPITVVGALLILYKTRHLTMATVFIVTAYVLIVVNGLLAGQTLGYMVLAAVVSWPLVFFAGFMLSEPLTLPPRRYQQMGLAGFVAILFAVPLSVGSISMSPEIALVIANIIAFAMGQRRVLQLTLAGFRDLTPTSKAFAFTTPQPPRFHAGQYIELTLPHTHEDIRGQRRMFSIVSAPGDGVLELGMKMATPSSSFKQALTALPIGAQLHATLISGDFVLPKKPQTKLLMVAGGIGITPFISQLQSLARSSQARDIVLIYAVKQSTELAYVDILQESGIKVIVVSEYITEQLPGFTYAQQPYVNASLIASYVPDAKERTAYISGPPLMVEAVKSTLKTEGVTRIKTDHFSGY